MSEQTAPAYGRCVWNELLTRDTEMCSACYPQVIPWHPASVEMPGVGRMGVLADRLGAAFAVYKSAPQPATCDG